MGITINVVEALTKYKQNLIIRDRGQLSDKSVAECSNLTMKEVVECLDFAIDTMNKYQKIEKIIDDWNNQKINNIICYLDVKEVIESGNDN